MNENHKLLIRQVVDIQNQAQQILNGNDENVVLENFTNYSTELINYINENIKNESIKAFIQNFPKINYQRNKSKLWQYLVFPFWAINAYYDYQAKKKTIDEITTLRGKYASLELLLRGLQ